MAITKGFLLTLRTHRGNMGIRAAAKEIGISPTTLSRVENGHIPDIKTLEKICRWSGIKHVCISFKERIVCFL